MAKLSEDERRRRALARARREAVAAEEDDRRGEERRQQWVREGAYLSYEELQDGVLCRGCGEALIDGLGGWPPLMALSAGERAEYNAVRFRERPPRLPVASLEHLWLSHDALRVLLPAATAKLAV